MRLLGRRKKGGSRLTIALCHGGGAFIRFVILAPGKPPPPHEELDQRLRKALTGSGGGARRTLSLEAHPLDSNLIAISCRDEEDGEFGCARDGRTHPQSVAALVPCTLYPALPHPLACPQPTCLLRFYLHATC